MRSIGYVIAVLCCFGWVSAEAAASCPSGSSNTSASNCSNLCSATQVCCVTAGNAKAQVPASYKCY